jgi:hypothetical protein
MTNLQKVGGVAALFEAVAYVVGFVVMATLLNPGDTSGWSPEQKLAFILQRKSIFQPWTLFIYVAFGIALVPLTVALHNRLKTRSPELTSLATPFGLIWAGLVIASGMVASVGLEAMTTLNLTNSALAASAWMTIGIVQDALGGGVEIVGGIWVLLISATALRSREFPKSLNYIGLTIGAFGILTIVPSLGDLGTIFGLGQILWFVLVGTAMLRGARNEEFKPNPLRGSA